MTADRNDPAPGLLLAQVALLIVCAVGFERGLSAFEAWIPREIFFESSFTLGLFRHAPWLLLLLVPGLWPLRPDRAARYAWSPVDSVGGLRWVAFGVAAMLAWTHAGHAINDYYGQAHTFDRWLLVGLAAATLRSPLAIAIFAFQLAISRAQLHHPVNSLAPIGDELPLRLLGVIFTAAFLNLAATTRGAEKIAGALRLDRFDRRITTTGLVFAVLCFVGSYYGYAGLAKLTIGRSPFDWMQEVHLENLFVAAYLNGWTPIGSAESMLEFAKTVALLSLPVAILTVVVECGMMFVLVHRHLTLVLVVAIAAMHVGIVLLSGIFFWKWLGIDLLLAAWLFRVRDDSQVRALYSPGNALVSVALIGLTMLVFGLNEFTWWNTRWVSIVDVEVRDTSGVTYRVDPRDFDPYILKDFMQPPGTVADTVGFGTTFSQAMMERVQNTDARTLRSFLARRRMENRDKTHEDQRHNATDFMSKVFSNRNRRVAESGPGSDRLFPFVVSAPPIHLRGLRGKNLYRDQAPVAEVLIRHIEIFYTGDSLVRLSDEVLHRVGIPAS